MNRDSDSDSTSLSLTQGDLQVGSLRIDDDMETFSEFESFSQYYDVLPDSAVELARPGGLGQLELTGRPDGDSGSNWQAAGATVPVTQTSCSLAAPAALYQPVSLGQAAAAMEAPEQILRTLADSDATAALTSTVAATEVVEGAAAQSGSKRRRKDIRPREGGLDGEFSRMLSRDPLGVTTRTITLCLNPKGQKLQLEPSAKREDYVSIDTRTLYGIYPQEERRTISDAGRIMTKCLSILATGSKLEVGHARSWLRHSKDPTGAILNVPAPRYVPHIITSRRKLLSAHDTATLLRMEEPFSHNFTARMRAAPGFNLKGFRRTAQDTMYLLCKAIGLQSGKNADDCCNKYYLTACQQKGGINRYDSIIKASTGDIPLPDANAIDDMMHSSVDEENSRELVKDNPDMQFVG